MRRPWLSIMLAVYECNLRSRDMCTLGCWNTICICIYDKHRVSVVKNNIVLCLLFYKHFKHFNKYMCILTFKCRLSKLLQTTLELHGVPKKGDTIFMAITLLTQSIFKCFRWHFPVNLQQPNIIKEPTTPLRLYVATLLCGTLMSDNDRQSQTTAVINDKLQDIVVTYLRCGETVNNQIKKCLLFSPPVKNVFKAVHIWHNYGQNGELCLALSSSFSSVVTRHTKFTIQLPFCLQLCQMFTDFNFLHWQTQQ